MQLEDVRAEPPPAVSKDARSTALVASLCEGGGSAHGSELEPRALAELKMLLRADEQLVERAAEQAIQALSAPRATVSCYSFAHNAFVGCMHVGSSSEYIHRL